MMQTISNEATIQAWSTYDHTLIEEFGDEGDASRRYMLNPVLFAALGDVAGRHILDAGCGTGYLCRLLARRGAFVTGIEPATGFFAYAVEREAQAALGITYLQQDLSRFTSEPDTFDAVVANMVFMDIPDYQRAMRNCIAALKSGGQFIFSLLHPCFDEIDSPAFVKGYRAKGYIRVDEYLNEFTAAQAWGYHFHRPLSTYLNFAVDGGCHIRRIIEPSLTPEGIQALGQDHPNLHVPSFIVINATKA